MTILKTKADVDTISELRKRKAELKIKIDAEQTEIKEVWKSVRADMQPGAIVGQAVKSMLGLVHKPENAADETALNIAGRLNGPLRVAADLLVRDPKIALLLKVVTPLTVAYLPNLARKAKSLVPEKKQMFGALRKGVAGLRKRFKKRMKDE